MNLTYILILVVLGIFLLVFVYIEPMLAKHNIKNSNEYGSARFSTFKEVQKTFDKENMNHIKNIGFSIWFDKNLKTVWMDKETPHWVYLGSTGSGKSVTQVISYCSFLLFSHLPLFLLYLYFAVSYLFFLNIFYNQATYLHNQEAFCLY